MSHPRSGWIKFIHSSSWYRSCHWNLFCLSAVSIESCYNRSMKITTDLFYSTHPSLIEYVTAGTNQIKSFLYQYRILRLISNNNISNVYFSIPEVWVRHSIVRHIPICSFKCQQRPHCVVTYNILWIFQL